MPNYLSEEDILNLGLDTLQKPDSPTAEQSNNLLQKINNDRVPEFVGIGSPIFKQPEVTNQLQPLNTIGTDFIKPEPQYIPKFNKVREILNRDFGYDIREEMINDMVSNSILPSMGIIKNIGNISKIPAKTFANKIIDFIKGRKPIEPMNIPKEPIEKSLRNVSDDTRDRLSVFVKDKDRLSEVNRVPAKEISFDELMKFLKDK